MSDQKLSGPPLNREDFESHAYSTIHNAEANASELARLLRKWEERFPESAAWFGNGLSSSIPSLISDDHIIVNGKRMRAIGLVEPGARKSVTYITSEDGKLWCRTGSKVVPTTDGNYGVTYGNQYVYQSWRLHLIENIDERLWEKMLHEANEQIKKVLRLFDPPS